ncbi:1-(5-phosphoribosyl)-5-[(5-phosphoribosylamino)methylideneamino] imidazole-4-carboxamide isomerase [Buchnera aphidicola]|uniref:1-(5-phosphoribosyl)-5-[(5- phosphoribosylamino)methylideneamino] imidazole-4-carboxamide isomerase n=1 Tax=Buchnera aphidicola TaxID=9 RepID=UPI0034641546
MIIPALDILNNQVVRLYQGNYDSVKYYDYYVYDLISTYIASGSKIIHLVDLESARTRNQKRSKAFYEIIFSFKECIQMAGGINSKKEIDKLFSIGAKRIVIGSEAINNIKKVKKWIEYYGNQRIVVALDINIIQNNIKTIFINGWKKNTNICLEDFLHELSSVDIKYVLCTDISKDGTLSGPNFSLYQDLILQFPKIHFQASGGIHHLNDIVRLKNIGVKDVIIGKSLLENKFTIAGAIKCWQKGSFHASMLKKDV